MSDDHLSLGELAELDEGLLEPDRISVVRAHLKGCDRCRDRAQALTTTRSILAELPETTMPDEVTARLDRALNDEAAERAEVSRAGDRDAAPRDPAHPAQDVVPAPGSVARRRIGRPTLPAIAVAAALVLAVGAIVVGALNHGNSPTESGGASASIAGQPQGVNGGPADIISSAQPSNFIQTSTGQSYTAATLAPDVQGLITRAATAPAASRTAAQRNSPRHGAAEDTKNSRHKAAGFAAAGSPTPSSTPDTLSNQPVARVLQPLASSRAKILSCAARLTGTKNAVPLAVDFGTWTNPQNGHAAAAAIFVFSAADPSKLAVFISAPDCDGTFLRFQFVPRQS